MDDMDITIPSITKQVGDIKLERGHDRCVPPSPYYQYLGDVLPKRDVHAIVQYIKRKLDNAGQ